MSYFSEVFRGLSEYFTVNKLLVVCVAIILYEYCVCEKLSSFLRYTVVTMLLVLLPPGAVMLLVYQHAIYDYGYLWTLVPIVAVVSYAGVILFRDILGKGEKRGYGSYLICALVACSLLFLSGNGQSVQSVSKEQANQRRAYDQLAEALPEGTVLWGEKDLMQWIRRKNAGVKLIYGLDMWDATAAAYDGDAYSPELVEAYKWMQEVDAYEIYAENYDIIGMDMSEEILAELPQAFAVAESMGANVIVFATVTYSHLQEYLPSGYEVQEVGEYTLLLGK